MDFGCPVSFPSLNPPKRIQKETYVCFEGPYLVQRSTKHAPALLVSLTAKSPK